MKRLAKVWCVGMVMLGWSVEASAQSSAKCAARPGDEAGVVETLRGMFGAAKTDDLERFHTLATKDFYAYDGGMRFDGDALMGLMKTLHGQGKVYEWSVTEPEVHVDCDTAWVTYVNHGWIKDTAGTKTDMTWLESAVMVRDGGAWRVRFIHSTRVPVTTVK